MATEPPGKLKYKTFSYSTVNPKTGEEENMYRPKHVEAKLNELADRGWFILWAFNTPDKIELIMAKVEGELSKVEQMKLERKARDKVLRERGLSKDFNTW